jgi:hypothetical protein
MPAFSCLKLTLGEEGPLVREWTRNKTQITMRGWGGEPNGGVKENRTPDLLLAKQALYQLSYNPRVLDFRTDHAIKTRFMDGGPGKT